VFHAVLANGFVYVPGVGGTIIKLNEGDGSVSLRINPFGGGPDAQTFVAGPLSADDLGNVYYNAKLDATDPWGASGTGCPGLVARQGDCRRQHSEGELQEPRAWRSDHLHHDLQHHDGCVLAATARGADGACGSQRVG